MKASVPRRSRLLLAFLSTIAAACGADIAAEGSSFVWWRDGPPYVRWADNWKTSQEVLCFQTNEVGLMLDTVSLHVLHAGRFAQPVAKSEVLVPGDASLRTLPSPGFELRVTSGGKTYRCVGRGPRPKDDFFFPVRIIESGRFLQHAVVADLLFEDDHRQRWAGSAALNISLWPDRIVLHARSNVATEGTMTLQLGGQHVSASLGRGVTLTLFSRTGASQAPSVAAGGNVTWDDSRGTWEVALKVPPWPDQRPDHNTTADLNRLDRWRFTLRNPSDESIAIPLMFVPETVRGITGLTPLLCEPDGTPTGLPVQVSKNWHLRPDKGNLPEEGLWLHAVTQLVLPPHTSRDLVFTLVYAQWGGVPAVSHAQLSLVGWGHNQFWDEAAIGSFGESICFEPGRVQRRCFITDIRPLMTLGQEREPGGWPNNAGGGDFLMWIDRDGQWRGFTGTKVDYRSQGPCLTDVIYHEQTAGGEITSRVRVRLPRSDDYLRVFFNVRYDVRAVVRWQRLAFFQLGADFYNVTPARRVAIGDRTGMREEWQARPEKLGYGRRAVPLTGENPWISLHAVDHMALRPANAAATRGLIIRSWNAVFGGKPNSSPHGSELGTEIAKGSLATALELSAPPGITELLPGDFVEADLELVTFPAIAADYWGPNAAFRQMLERHADTWTPVHREAEANALTTETRHGTIEESYPLRVRLDAAEKADITVRGGLAYVPVTFTGVAASRNFVFKIDGQLVDQSVHGNDYWQTDPDPATRTTALTFNVPLADGAAHRLEFSATDTREGPSATDAAGAARPAMKRETMLAP